MLISIISNILLQHIIKMKSFKAMFSELAIFLTIGKHINQTHTN